LMVSPFPRVVQIPPGPARPLIPPFSLSVVWKTCQVFLVALVFPGMIGLSCAAATEKRAFELEQTMLMFVGEELGVLTIASRREESALQAPAIAQVVTRREIREQGATTLSQVLERVPGFHMAQRESGTEPYLRGIPNSILFLHDAVPLISETTKSIHPLDHELSLDAVKRIEIIRGPGSALWGPDAFAGIVNVVPLTGKDLDGLETG
jgi:outer membrane cobalamin receptor